MNKETEEIIEKGTRKRKEEEESNKLVVIKRKGRWKKK